MKPIQRPVLITLIVINALGLLLAAGNSALSGRGELAFALGMTNFWGGLLALIVGVLVSIRAEWRSIGQGMMLAGAFMALLGFTICSTAL